MNVEHWYICSSNLSRQAIVIFSFFVIINVVMALSVYVLFILMSYVQALVKAIAYEANGKSKVRLKWKWNNKRAIKIERKLQLHRNYDYYYY